MWTWSGKEVSQRVYINSFVARKTLCFQISWMSLTKNRAKSWMSTFIIRKKLLNCVSVLKNINWFISTYIAYCFQESVHFIVSKKESRISPLYALLQGVIGFERNMLTTTSNTSYWIREAAWKLWKQTRIVCELSWAKANRGIGKAKTCAKYSKAKKWKVINRWPLKSQGANGH